MKTITYTDHEGGAPTVSWLGREFTTLVPVEVDKDRDADLIEAAKSNRYFTVEDGGSAPSYDETIVGKGEAAARAGKTRLVPPAYRGEDKRDQAEAWLFGFDKVPPNTDPFADTVDTTEPLADAVRDAPDHPVSVTQTIQNEKDASGKDASADNAKASS